MAMNKGEKPVYRIIMEKHMNAELEDLKKVSGITIAEHMRRAMKHYLLFKNGDGLIDDLEITRFMFEYKKKSARLVKKGGGEKDVSF